MFSVSVGLASLTSKTHGLPRSANAFMMASYIADMKEDTIQRTMRRMRERVAEVRETRKVNKLYEFMQHSL